MEEIQNQCQKDYEYHVYRFVLSKKMLQSQYLPKLSFPKLPPFLIPIPNDILESPKEKPPA